MKLRYILTVLIGLIYFGTGSSPLFGQSYLIDKIQPAQGEQINITDVNMMGMMVRFRSGPNLPDSLVITGIRADNGHFPAGMTGSRSGVRVMEDHGDWKICESYFTVRFSSNSGIHTEGNLSINIGIYKNGVVQLPIGVFYRIKQSTTRIEPGIISSSQVIAPNKIPAPLTGTPAISYNGTCNYTWLKDEGNGWQVIPGSSGVNYTPGALNKTTRYKRRAYDTYTSGESGIVTITVSTDQIIKSDRNYISVSHPRENVLSLSEVNHINSRMQLNYYDGLGRLEQTVDVAASPGGRDVIQLLVYDLADRSDIRQYLPYVATDGLFGAYRSGSENAQNQYYRNFYNLSSGNASAYTQNEYEMSVSGKLKTSCRPGPEYGPSKSIRYTYGTNSPQEVRRFTIGSTLTLSGYEPAATLHKTVQTDENGCRTAFFTDFAGKTILERRYNGNSPADLYYVYNSLGWLLYVVSPQGVAALLAGEANAVEKYSYAYNYNAAGDLTNIRLPGQQTDYREYNSARLLKRQMINTVGWISYQYDAFNRITGEFYSRRDISDNLPLRSYSYDSYPSGALSFFAEAGFDNSYDNRTKGFKTYEKCRLLDKQLAEQHLSTAPFVERTFYYDSRGRLIQIAERNHTGGISRYSYKYDRQGNVLAQQERHNTGGNDMVVKQTMEYDPGNRLLKREVYVNNTLCAKVGYAYDELGRISRHTYNDGTAIPSDTLLYTMQGWLSEQRHPAFSFALRYTNPQFAKPDYSGNIAEISWEHADSGQQQYAFSYDSLGRFTDSRRYTLKNGSMSPDNYFCEKNLTYDLNGNLLTLQRFSSSALADNLTYAYEGNLLKSLTESCSDSPGDIYPRGKVGEATYEYDHSGHLLKDSRRALKFKYNLLNLTERAEDLSGLEVVRYVYGYDGLKNRAISGAGIEYVYLGSLTYMGFAQSLNPESIVFPEGRIAFSGQVPQTYYHLTDHLGSVRTILSSDGSVRERNGYYPLRCPSFPQRLSPTGTKPLQIQRQGIAAKLGAALPGLRRPDAGPGPGPLVRQRSPE